MLKYESLSEELTERMERENASGSYVKTGFDNRGVVRRHAVA